MSGMEQAEALEKQALELIKKLGNLAEVDDGLLKRTDRKLKQGFNLLKVTITNADLDRAVV